MNGMDEIITYSSIWWIIKIHLLVSFHSRSVYNNKKNAIPVTAHYVHTYLYFCNTPFICNLGILQCSSEVFQIL